MKVDYKNLFLFNLKCAFISVLTKLIYEIIDGTGMGGPALLFIFIPIFYLVAFQFILTSGILLIIKNKLQFDNSRLNIKGASIVLSINFIVFNLIIWFLDMNFQSNSLITVLFAYLVTLFLRWNKSK